MNEYIHLCDCFPDEGRRERFQIRHKILSLICCCQIELEKNDLSIIFLAADGVTSSQYVQS